MKKTVKPSFLACLALLAGLVGMLLRAWTFSKGIDEKGLCIRMHPSVVLTWILCALYAAAQLLLVRPIEPRKVRFERVFRASLPAALGTAVGAFGIVWEEITVLSGSRDLLLVVTAVLGFAAAACMVYAALLRVGGKPPVKAAWILPTVYFLLRLASRYRQWSWEPQLSLLAFPVLASALLAISVYCKAAMGVGMDTRRQFLLATPSAAVLSLISAVGVNTVFHVCMAVWMLSECAFANCTGKRVEKRPAPQSAPSPPEAAQ